MSRVWYYLNMNFEKIEPNPVHEGEPIVDIEEAIANLKTVESELLEQFPHSKTAVVSALTTLAAQVVHIEDQQLKHNGNEALVGEGQQESTLGIITVSQESIFFDGNERSIARACELARELGIESDEKDKITVTFVGNLPVEINGSFVRPHLTSGEQQNVEYISQLVTATAKHAELIEEGE